MIPLQVATGLHNGSMYPVNYLQQTFGSVLLRLQERESIGQYDGNARQDIIDFIMERLETKLVFHALMTYLLFLLFGSVSWKHLMFVKANSMLRNNRKSGTIFIVNYVLHLCTF